MSNLIKEAEAEQAQAMLTILEAEYNKTPYEGFDDDYEDHLNSYIENLTDEELSSICINIFRKGV